MKTIIILGTSRRTGNTAQLVNVIKDNLDADILNLSDYQISPYDYQSNNSADDFIALIDKVLSYEDIIFSSPVYWYAMSAQIKIFFDRLADLVTIEKERGRTLRGKSCSLVATGGSDWAAEGFEKPFELSAGYFDMVYKGMLYCPYHDDFLVSGHKKEIADFIEYAKRK